METKDDQIVRSIGNRIYPADAKFDSRISSQEIRSFDHIIEKLFTKYGWDNFPALPPKIDDGCV